MQTVPAGPASELSFPIRYQVVGGSAYNSQFSGAGTLLIHTDGPTYSFAGRRRLPFWRGRARTAEFGADEISNVTASGRLIRFDPAKGAAGQRARPFVFYCADAATATRVAALLPQRKDAEHVAAQDFVARLRALRGGGPAWGSATNLLVALNAAVFVVMAAGLGAGWFDVSDLTPYVRYGANNGAATTGGEWWRLVTSMFMHYGLLHLLLNMWALFQVGNLVEKLLGRIPYLTVYLGSGIIGGLASVVWHGDRMWSVGASGAVFGVYGALLGCMLREKQGIPRSVFQPMLTSTLGFAGYNLFYGLVHPAIDNAAHIGGFLSGIVIGWLVAVPLEAGPRMAVGRKRLLQGLLAWAGLAAIGVIAAPRYDYVPTEELAWSNALQDVNARETALLRKAQSLLTDISRNAPGAVPAYAGFLEQEFIPFYRELHRRVAAMRFSAGHRTERQRVALLEFCQTRADAAVRLAAALRAGAPAALADYQRADAAATEALKKALGKQ